MKYLKSFCSRTEVISTDNNRGTHTCGYPVAEKTFPCCALQNLPALNLKKCLLVPPLPLHARYSRRAPAGRSVHKAAMAGGGCGPRPMLCVPRWGEAERHPPCPRVGVVDTCARSFCSPRARRLPALTPQTHPHPQGLVIVPAGRAYVVERLGKFHATLSPGLHLLIPFVDRIAYAHDLRETFIPLRGSAVSRDNVILEVRAPAACARCSRNRAPISPSTLSTPD